VFPGLTTPTNLYHLSPHEEVSVAHLGQVEFSRIGPLLAELEEGSLTPPAPALIAKIAAINQVRADILMLVVEALQYPNHFSILECDGDLFVIASPH
jgi:hypothetical protein